MEFANSIFLSHCVKDPSARQVADASNTTWRSINNALSPVIGQKGVVALFQRSLHLQRTSYPVLNAMRDTKTLPIEFITELHAVLILQTNTNALLITNALLDTFYDLLTNLIGNPLTRKLLHSNFAAPSSNDPAQDILS